MAIAAARSTTALPLRAAMQQGPGLPPCSCATSTERPTRASCAPGTPMASAFPVPGGPSMKVVSRAKPTGHGRSLLVIQIEERFRLGGGVSRPDFAEQPRAGLVLPVPQRQIFDPLDERPKKVGQVARER